MFLTHILKFSVLSSKKPKWQGLLIQWNASPSINKKSLLSNQEALVVCKKNSLLEHFARILSAAAEEQRTQATY